MEGERVYNVWKREMGEYAPFFASMHICHIRRMGREVYSSQVAQEGGKESCNILEMCCYVMQYTDILTYVNTMLSHRDLTYL